MLRALPRTRDRAPQFCIQYQARPRLDRLKSHYSRHGRLLRVNMHHSSWRARRYGSKMTRLTIRKTKEVLKYKVLGISYRWDRLVGVSAFKSKSLWLGESEVQELILKVVFSSVPSSKHPLIFGVLWKYWRWSYWTSTITCRSCLLHSVLDKTRRWQTQSQQRRYVQDSCRIDRY